MIYFLLTTFFLFSALAVAAALSLVSLFRLSRPSPGVFPLLYLGVSAASVVSLLRALLRQHCGIACAMPSLRTVLLYGGLAFLLAYFLYDSFQWIKKEKKAAKPPRL